MLHVMCNASAHSYLEWMEQNGLTCHCEYMKTLQKCTSYFDEKEYYNTDIRLANVYIKLVSDPASQPWAGG